MKSRVGRLDLMLAAAAFVAVTCVGDLCSCPVIELIYTPKNVGHHIGDYWL